MRCKHRRKNDAGYTLAEMMVVIVIIGIIAAIIVPNFAGYLKRQHEIGSRNQLMSDIYYARSLAIARRHTMRIDFAGQQYKVVDTVSGAVAKTVDAPAGVTFAATGNPNFYAWGLADAADITVTGGGSTSTVSVLPSGSVEHVY